MISHRDIKRLGNIEQEVVDSFDTLYPTAIGQVGMGIIYAARIDSEYYPGDTVLHIRHCPEFHLFDLQKERFNKDSHDRYGKKVIFDHWFWIKNTPSASEIVLFVEMFQRQSESTPLYTRVAVF